MTLVGCVVAGTVADENVLLPKSGCWKVGKSTDSAALPLDRYCGASTDEEEELDLLMTKREFLLVPIDDTVFLLAPLADSDGDTETVGRGRAGE